MKPQINVDVKSGDIISAYIETSFDEGKSKLEKAKYGIISFRKNARLRLQEGKYSFISQNGNWVKEGFLYLPNTEKFLTKKAIQVHGTGEEIYLTDEQVEQALSDSLKLPNNNFSVPTNSFGDKDDTGLTNYIFGDFAEEYGDFLCKKVGIKEMPIEMADNCEDKRFIRQAWFGRLFSESKLIGYTGLAYRVRGINNQ